MRILKKQDIKNMLKVGQKLEACRYQSLEPRYRKTLTML